MSRTSVSSGFTRFIIYRNINQITSITIKKKKKSIDHPILFRIRKFSTYGSAKSNFNDLLWFGGYTNEWYPTNTTWRILRTSIRDSSTQVQILQEKSARVMHEKISHLAGETSSWIIHADSHVFAARIHYVHFLSGIFVFTLRRMGLR